ncbi:unnamed protein product [Toxocara canis]|uniref:Uncharacterized protein n=1 Tax=Toxocara canis TaxID=6265 RepID=A0A3P7F8L6_TOXCA|nr:unnamed protein product [Toxocara canis]
MRDLLHGADGADLHSEGFLEKLRQIKDEAKEAVAQCAGENSGTPLIKDTKPKRVAMYDLKESKCSFNMGF